MSSVTLDWMMEKASNAESAVVGCHDFKVYWHYFGCVRLGCPLHAMEDCVVNFGFTLTVHFAQYVYETRAVSVVGGQPGSRIVEPSVNVRLLACLRALGLDKAESTFAPRGGTSAIFTRPWPDPTSLATSCTYLASAEVPLLYDLWRG